MQTVIITILEDALAASMESLLWKYGSAIEGADNFKLVYNTKSSRTSNAVDAHVIDDSFETRAQEAIDYLRDFMPEVEETAGAKQITLSMSNRWSGSQKTLKAAMEKYILDGMMNDWLTATAPTEAAIYGARLDDDVNKIKADIYSLRKPIIPQS